KLREVTGAGVMDCKKALREANGNFDKAIEVIRERGAAIAEKRGERKTGAGVLESFVHNGRVGVLLELRTETDFVARSEPFQELAHEIVMQIAAMEPENAEALLKQSYIKDESMDVEGLINSVIAKVGENIKVERFCRYEL
ncbi:translation elongation factor Ts, partial [Candidatus Jorgensenbacteria bacterium GWC1_48_12]